MRKGWKNHTIRKELGITVYDYDIYIRDIKSKKIMTSDEIEEARNRKRQEDLSFVADAVNNGLTMTEIREQKPEFSYNEVTPMIKELIAAGVITQEKVDENAKNGSKRTINKAVEMSPEEQIQFILDKVRKGYIPSEIVKSDKTKSLTLHKVLYQKRQLIAKGIISEEEADKAMKKRQEKAVAIKHKRLIKKIKEYTELGYTLTEIANFIKEYSYSYLVDIKNNYAKENGWYTKEELKVVANLRKAREAEESRIAFEKLPAEERKKIEEERMAEAKRSEDEERKRQEEILERKQKRKDESRRKRQEDAEKLKEHLKNGETIEEAAKLIKCSTAYAYKIKRESVQNNTWLTDEELKAINKKKKQKLARARKKREQQKIKEQNRKKEENDLRIKAEVWKLREYIGQGYTYKEISTKMNYSTSYLQKLTRIALNDNIWFTKEDIKEFKRLREKREALEREKTRKKEQKRQERERREAEKAIKEEENARKALDKERRRKIRSYNENYKRYRKLAKREDKLELDGEENVTTEGRRKFIGILINLQALEANISDKDVKIVLNAFDVHPEIADKKSIRFLLLDANRKGGIKGAERMIIELSNTLRYTKFYNPLLQYGRWLKKQALRPTIQDMKKRGMNNTDIGEKLGISSLEVSIIFHNDEELDFQI